MKTEYTDLLKKIRKYVLNSEKINALALIGSYSKKDDSCDEYSDLDLIIVNKYVNDFLDTKCPSVSINQ